MEKSIFHLMILSCESSYSIIHNKIQLQFSWKPEMFPSSCFSLFLVCFGLIVRYIGRTWYLRCADYPLQLLVNILLISLKRINSHWLKHFFLCRIFKPPLNLQLIFFFYLTYNKKKISSPFNGNIFNWTWDSFSSQHIDDSPS